MNLIKINASLYCIKGQRLIPDNIDFNSLDPLSKTYLISDCNTYILRDNNKQNLSEDLAIVDPGFLSTKAMPNRNKFNFLTSKGFDLKNISKVVATHAHGDHMSIFPELKKKLSNNVNLYLHRNASSLMSQQNKNVFIVGKSEYYKTLSEIYRIENFPNLYADILLREDDIIKIGNSEWKVIETPGHSSDGVCLYSKDFKALITGDTIYSAKYNHESLTWDDVDTSQDIKQLKRAYHFGRTDIFSASKEQLKNSIEKILDLDFNMVLPGHGAVLLERGKEVVEGLYRKVFESSHLKN
ncbi:MAG: MBL fold metallo-hydrolase [Pseudomonadota bacterium]